MQNCRQTVNVVLWFLETSSVIGVHAGYSVNSCGSWAATAHHRRLPWGSVEAKGESGAGLLEVSYLSGRRGKSLAPAVRGFQITSPDVTAGGNIIEH